MNLPLWNQSFGTGRGKNAPDNIYLRKAINLIDFQLELLRMKVEHPEQFISSEPTFKSDLYIKPKSHDLGIIGLVEIVVALSLSGHVLGTDGKPAPLIKIAKVFEQAFNVSFGNIYIKRGTLFNRKGYNLTKTLEKLIECLRNEDKKQYL